MDPFRGVKVEVLSQGCTLDLYDDPNSDETTINSDPFSRSQYVEAVTGATFTVNVSVSEAFELRDLGANDAIRVVVRYDGTGVGSQYELVRRDIEELLRTKGNANYLFDLAWEYCKTTGQWSKGNTVFSALAIEDTDRADSTPDQIKKLGSIRIEIQRVRRFRRHTIATVRPPSSHPISAVSEKMIKGKAIANVVKLQNMSVGRPADLKYDLVPLEGEAGKLLCVNIHYRSRQNLQSIGCIPRTPTPEPELREEVRTLRERLALLEHHDPANVKAESLRSAASIKREREEVENQRDRKRSRNSGVETVDLTGDPVDLARDFIDLSGD